MAAKKQTISKGLGRVLSPTASKGTKAPGPTTTIKIAPQPKHK